MIPVNIDAAQIIADLTARGWRDYKIEIICGLPAATINKLRSGKIRHLSYPNAARLFNFWEDECFGNVQALSNTT